MKLSEEFLREVENYLVVSGMAPTRFGKEAIGDFGFVAELRAGRSAGTKTIDRVRDYIELNPAHTAAQEKQTKSSSI
jgi:hypothetical protein